jgi:hypothetical protein
VLVVPATGAAERDQAIAAAARDHGVPVVSPSPATIETPTGAGESWSAVDRRSWFADRRRSGGGGEADVVCDRLAPLAALQHADRGVDYQVAKIRAARRPLSSGSTKSSSNTPQRARQWSDSRAVIPSSSAEAAKSGRPVRRLASPSPSSRASHRPSPAQRSRVCR